MLDWIEIQNFATIESIHLSFDTHLTMITGETGAGKSVFLSAIQYLLGSKHDKKYERTDQTPLLVKGAFRRDDSLNIDAAIHQNKPLLTIERAWKNGRNIIAVNQQPVTLQQLRQITKPLMTIHAQHQSNALTDTNKQREYLDAFIRHDQALNALHEAYRAHQSLVQQLNIYEKRTQNPYYVELLKYQVEELKQLQLEDNEWEQLKTQHDELFHANARFEQASQVLTQLTDDGQGLAAQLFELQSLSKTLPEDIQTSIQQMDIERSELSRTLQSYLDHLNTDPESLHACESRMQQIYDIARKHKILPEQLTEHAQRLFEEYELIDAAESDIEKIKTAIIAAEQHYHSLAKTVSQSRHHAAPTLSKALATEMLELGFQHADVNIVVYTDTQAITAEGYDNIDFQLSSNPDFPPKSISKIASGGEISRISLALQVILSAYLKNQTLMFDEIDTGVSGKTGTLIGQKLRFLSRKTPVICITHLAQVAAFGDTQLCIQKVTEAGRTKTLAQLLNTKERVNALAQMLSGLTITPEAKKQARMLLEQVD